jgi:mRNA-degrading endonuclease RelE of RelBE toxin-antitoxin system
MSILKTAILIFAFGVLIKLFLTRTIIGRFALVILKDTYYLLKLFVRITRITLRSSYKISKDINKILKNQIKKLNYDINENEETDSINNKSKVVNGDNNIIDITKYRKRDH